MASIREMGMGAASQPTLEELRMTLPSAGCWNPQCRNMTAPAEDTLSVQDCSACATAHYCSRACQKAHWKAHKPACQS